MTVTEIIHLNAQSPDEDKIARAAAFICAGEVVAFPTETVYGLGANAFDAEAVEKIFAAKGRPAHDPLIVHIGAVDELSLVTKDIPDFAVRLASHFWPGPLTLVLKRQPVIPLNVSAGLETVAVRMPNHPIALALIRASQTAIAAPSANLFSGVSPTSAQHVLADLNGRIPMILDGGRTLVGVESTVIDCTSWPPVVLRPGGIGLEELREFLGEVAVHSGEKGGMQVSASPGMLDKHYSPRARLFYCLTEREELYRDYFQTEMTAQLRSGHKVGMLVTSEDQPWLSELFPGIEQILLGSEKEPQQIAAGLYAALREMDERQVDCIFVRDIGTEGVALAIRDRLIRAAYEVKRFSDHQL